jgi:acyl dehydratase
MLTIENLRHRIGEEIAVSEWLEIDQNRVNLFADATDDHQWIHVDVDRARRESPYGAPIAHGFLTLSLLARFSGELLRAEGVRLGLNYGLDKVRFISPVRVGDRLRARYTLGSLTDVDGGVQVSWTATIEIEGTEKPACVAQTLVRWLF